jgi:hypothetical protein
MACCSVLPEHRRSQRPGKSEQKRQNEHVAEWSESPFRTELAKLDSSTVGSDFSRDSQAYRTREGMKDAGGDGFGTGDFLSPVLLDDQNHAGAQNGHVLVVALQGSDGSLVGSGNRIERFARLHFVMKNTGLLLGIFIRIFR